MLKKLFSLFGKAETTQPEPQRIPVEQQNVSYIFLDMQGTAFNNQALVQQIHDLKKDYNIKIIACSASPPKDVKIDLEDMQCDHMIDHIWSGNYGYIGFNLPEGMSDYEKDSADFWNNISLDDQSILPQDMFLIDDAQKNGAALKEAGGYFHHFFDEKNSRTTKNQNAVAATKAWLDKRVQAQIKRAGSFPS